MSKGGLHSRSPSLKHLVFQSHRARVATVLSECEGCRGFWCLVLELVGCSGQNRVVRDFLWGVLSLSCVGKNWGGLACGCLRMSLAEARVLGWVTVSLPGHFPLSSRAPQVPPSRAPLRFSRGTEISLKVVFEVTPGGSLARPRTCCGDWPCWFRSPPEPLPWARGSAGPGRR